MKYTRYDYRRKKGDKTTVIVMFASIVLAALLLGTLFSSIFLKDKPTSTSSPVENTKNEGEAVQDAGAAEKNPSTKFIVIQSGYFGVKSNADVQKDKLKKVINPFTVEDDGKFRVLAGIYNEGEYEKVLEKIVQQGLDNAKTTYIVENSDQSVYQISEIMKGHLKILTTLTEATVTAVKTEEFKTWISSLSKIEESSEHSALLEEYKKYINSLPVEIGKDKAEENYIYIYGIIKKIGVKK